MDVGKHAIKGLNFFSSLFYSMLKLQQRTICGNADLKKLPALSFRVWLPDVHVS